MFNDLRSILFLYLTNNHHVEKVRKIFQKKLEKNVAYIGKSCNFAAVFAPKEERLG